MSGNDTPQTREGGELARARRASAGLIWAAVLFSFVVNALMLTGPLYMLQVYDRVLGSGSEETLAALSLLVAGLFLAMGVLEFARSRVMAIVGARFQERLDRRVFTAAMQVSAVAPNDPAAVVAQRDLEAIRSFLASPVVLALMDLPWTPFFIAAVFIFHPLLGWLAVFGGTVLIVVTWLNQRLSRQPQLDAGQAALQSDRYADQLKAEAETLQALGMADAGFDRWQISRRTALREALAATGVVGVFGSMTKTFRLFLQSAMLGLGAWLVLQGELTAGAMIASSILMGRALAPIEMAVGQWHVAQRATEAWRRLSRLLSHVPPKPPRTTLPHPRALVEVDGLTVGAPGEAGAILRMVSFRIEPGQAVGVIGPSGSGKSTLAKALTGVWRPLAGKIRLDGATLDQYDPDVLGRLLGYLPQRITLFDGTIADNIARLDPKPESAKVVAAAKRADAHDMIVKLPHGYDTRISAAGGRLSGGQIQRIGLARALYGDPVLLILDEPNSNLDNPGSAAVNAAIRAMKSEGKAVLIMAHRPAAIQECDLLLVLEEGLRKGFGPRDQVLRELVRNHTDILKTAAPGGPV
jgi:ATP-binding cassette, subfamily C, bacterial